MNDDIIFDPKKIIEISKNALQHDALENMQNYNDEMTISQVVRFFEKQGIELTKTMIQNYVRVNVMPPPVDKRYYTKYHLILLTLISNLKNIYSLEEIKRLFTPILKDLTAFDDDMVDMNTIYDIFIKSHETSIKNWEKEIPELIKKTSSLVNESDIKEYERDPAYFFITILTLMAQSVVTRQYVKLLIDEYNKDSLE